VRHVILAALLVAGLAAFSVYQTVRKARAVAATPAERAVFLRANVPGYAVMDWLRTNAKGRVYQVALSEAIYYGPNPVWGDSLGPWRYGDYITLPPAAVICAEVILTFDSDVTCAQLRPESVLFHKPAVREP